MHAEKILVQLNHSSTAKQCIKEEDMTLYTGIHHSTEVEILTHVIYSDHLAILIEADEYRTCRKAK